MPDNTPSLTCSDDSIRVITPAPAPLAMPRSFAQAVSGDRPAQAVRVHMLPAAAMPPVQPAAVMPASHVQPATAMPHAHVHSAPMSNAANAAHQANVDIDSNTNMFSNAAASCQQRRSSSSIAYQQLQNPGSRRGTWQATLCLPGQQTWRGCQQEALSRSSSPRLTGLTSLFLLRYPSCTHALSC